MGVVITIPENTALSVARVLTFVTVKSWRIIFLSAENMVDKKLFCPVLEKTYWNSKIITNPFHTPLLFIAIWNQYANQYITVNLTLAYLQLMLNLSIIAVGFNIQ